jgi:hypothetical protein
MLRVARNRDRYAGAYKRVRPGVLERDGHKCRKCGLTQWLETHHVNGYEDNDPANIVTLCHYCHNIAPMREEFWVWLESGDDGITEAEDFVLGKVRAAYPELTDAEFGALCQSVLDRLEADREAELAEATAA